VSHILNITNGDCAVEIMKKADVPGGFLPWRDVLHEGPVPSDLSLEELSNVRAKYISDKRWGEPDKIQQLFLERDNLLKSYKNYQKVILWFEHDMYDQLQILQILDWFHDQELEETQLSLICTDQYLGMLRPEEMLELYKYEVIVTDDHLELAQHSWSAFRENTPEKWYGLLREDTSALEFLNNAIIRMIQEYPNRQNGLSRTEQQALTLISKGEKNPGKVFAQNQKLEERIFMGDSSFWDIINSFLKSSPSLVSLSKGKELTLPINSEHKLFITSVGEEVLLGKRNWIEINELNRWIGGVQLTQDNIWYRGSTEGIEIKVEQ